MASPIARVEGIHLAPTAGAPMRSVPQVRAISGVGLEGDRYAMNAGTYSDDPGTGRQITLAEAEVLDELRAEKGIDLAQGAIRRNVTTRGIRLNDLVGKRFLVGEVLCEGTRLCEPCQYMSDLVGQPVLRPLAHRGGLRADILSDGVIRVGDTVTPLGERGSA